MLFDILALISLLVILLLIRRIVDIFPSLMACMIRWKENVNLQASMKMRTDRDLLAVLSCRLPIQDVLSRVPIGPW